VAQKDLCQESLDLESLCLECGGKCGEQKRGKWYPCHACLGSGYVPSEFGKRVVALIRHNLKQILQDTRPE
jgi:reverse gyrase